MKNLLVKLITCSLLVTLVFSCSTTAKIQTNTRLEYRGTIIGSDEENVYIATQYATTAVKKTEIKKIVHPGLGRSIVGGIVGGYGVLNIVVGVPKISEQPIETQAPFAIGVFLPAGIGIPLIITGYRLYADSKAALNIPYTPPSGDN